MAYIRLYNLGGCEAIEKEEGNELLDLYVNRYLCGKKVSRVVIVPGYPNDVVKKLCEKQAKECEEKYNIK